MPQSLSPSCFNSMDHHSLPRMESKAFNAFKSKLFKPWPCRCETRCLVLPSFRFRLKTPIWVTTAFRFHRHRFTTPKKAHIRKKISAALRSIFHPSVMQLEEVDRLGELASVTEPERDRDLDRLLVSSPVTPAYLRTTTRRIRKKEVLDDHQDDDDVEEACRSFENYLAEMIVEEGKVKDLMDVEELLQCWKNLKCPIFTDMVGRFYGELCKDLFSGEEGESIDEPK